MLSGQIDSAAGCLFSTDFKSMVVIFESYKTYVIKFKSR